MDVRRRLPYVWGATDDEVSRRYPCDDLLDDTALVVVRAISVDAPTGLVYRWVCQVAVAPYSYDWIDNLGRRSPTELTPGADDLHVGDEVMVFRISEVVPGHHWTGRSFGAPARIFGDIAATYAVEPDGAGSRIVVRMLMARPGPLRWVLTYLLGWGDLIMMRKQLLTLAAYAERDARADHQGGAGVSGGSGPGPRSGGT